MQSSRRWQSAGRHTGWAMALLASVLAAPAICRASCGDYVRISGDAGYRAATGGNGMPSHPAPGPCHGPGCDRHPIAPPAPTTVSVQVEEWGCVLRSDDAAPGAPQFTHREEDAPRPVKRPSTVYHPPRPFASATA